MFSTKFLNLDYLSYNEALGLMWKLVNIKRSLTFPEVLIFLEHEPTLTMGRRGKTSDILVSQEYLAQEKIAVHRVKRGGLVTYHGPGQLVVYPIFNIHTMGLTIDKLVYGLEETVVKTLSSFGIIGNRKEGYRGVWVYQDKIASIGVAIRGGITYHGLALNYGIDLSHFDLIKPCGLTGIRMTSIAKILGRPINPSRLRETMASNFIQQFELDLDEWSLNQVEQDIG
jgi:lipoate-protein ligase B